MFAPRVLNLMIIVEFIYINKSCYYKNILNIIKLNKFTPGNILILTARYNKILNWKINY